jgi:O-antigen ligase
MENRAWVPNIDRTILFCLCVLVLFLPVAHTETIRAFALAVPGGLWIVKAILRRRPVFFPTPVDLPLLLFTAVASLSVITAVDWKYSLEEFIGDWVMGLFLFYLAVNHVRSHQMKYILGVLLIGNIIMVNYGIYDFFRQGGQLFDYQIRAGSLHSGFGTFSTYLVTVMPYIFIGLFFVTRTSLRWLLLGLLGLNFFSLYITQARGAWIAAAALVLIVGWKFLPRRVLFLSAGLAGLGFFLLAPRGIVWHKTPVSGPGAPQGAMETGGARWKLTKFSLKRIAENPFRMLGFGRRSFVKKYGDFYERYKGALLWHAHNTFLNITLQTGIQGLLFFCLFLYRLLRYCYARANLEKPSLIRFYLLATFMMIIAFFVRNLSDDFFVDDSALLFWFLSGTAFSLNQRVTAGA